MDNPVTFTTIIITVVILVALTFVAKFFVDLKAK